STRCRFAQQGAPRCAATPCRVAGRPIRAGGGRATPVALTGFAAAARIPVACGRGALRGAASCRRCPTAAGATCTIACVATVVRFGTTAIFVGGAGSRRTHHGGRIPIRNLDAVDGTLDQFLDVLEQLDL